MGDTTASSTDETVQKGGAEETVKAEVSTDKDQSKDTQRPILYSTEHFKIRLGNIHPRISHAQLKQKLNLLEVKPKKVKKMDHCDWAFVTFGCEDDRVNALKVLNGVEWRGKVLAAKKADAADDPLLQRKRKADESHDGGMAKQKATDMTLDDYKKKLLDSVAPLWSHSYEEQIEIKRSKLVGLMNNMKYEMLKAYKDLPKSDRPDVEYKDLLLPVKHSPDIDGYRNKCEFTVGRHPISSDICVGYRLGEYRQGTVAVLDPGQVPTTSDAMKSIASNFQTYVQNSAYAPFDPVSQTGHWMWLLVRTTSTGDVMVMPTFVQQELSSDDIEAVRNDLIRHYSEGDGKQCCINSLYIHVTPRQKKSEADATLPDHLWGKVTAEEVLLGLKFQISPSAFFQVNRAGAEVLYTAIADFAGLSDKTSTVLDVCCGTGTIGMILSKYAKSVIGVELVEEAVKDAEKNAKLNNVENISFKCGKAEAVLPALIKSVEHKEPMAIVDPPRAGLNREVILALRKTASLTKLVYVSCEPKSAIKNFVELMRPESKRWKGSPFKLIKMLPVDMFPYSRQCELVLLFEREAKVMDTSD